MALALLPECPSVLQNVCVVTCLHLILSAPWSYSSAGSLQPSNLSPLSVALSSASSLPVPEISVAYPQPSL